MAWARSWGGWGGERTELNAHRKKKAEKVEAKEGVRKDDVIALRGSEETRRLGDAKYASFEANLRSHLTTEFGRI
jgi:hypothetical protein